MLSWWDCLWRQSYSFVFSFNTAWWLRRCSWNDLLSHMKLSSLQNEETWWWWLLLLLFFCSVHIEAKKGKDTRHAKRMLWSNTNGLYIDGYAFIQHALSFVSSPNWYCDNWWWENQILIFSFDLAKDDRSDDSIYFVRKNCSHPSLWHFVLIHLWECPIHSMIDSVWRMLIECRDYFHIELMICRINHPVLVLDDPMSHREVCIQVCRILESFSLVLPVVQGLMEHVLCLVSMGLQRKLVCSFEKQHHWMFHVYQQQMVLEMVLEISWVTKKHPE